MELKPPCDLFKTDWILKTEIHLQWRSWICKYLITKWSFSQLINSLQHAAAEVLKAFLGQIRYVVFTFTLRIKSIKKRPYWNKSGFNVICYQSKRVFKSLMKIENMQKRKTVRLFEFLWPDIVALDLSNWWLRWCCLMFVISYFEQATKNLRQNVVPITHKI